MLRRVDRDGPWTRIRWTGGMCKGLARGRPTLVAWNSHPYEGIDGAGTYVCAWYSSSQWVGSPPPALQSQRRGTCTDPSRCT